MSTLLTRRVTTILSAALMLPLLLGTPAVAAKNNHGYTQSLEGIRKAHENYCATLLEDLKLAQDLAADEAGTKDGDIFSATADSDFDKGKEAGCKWATW